MVKNFSFKLFLYFFLLIALTFESYSISSRKISSLLKNSTVYIEVHNAEDEIYSRGTGTVINKKDGKYYILTNAHVVTEDWDTDKVEFLDEEYSILVYPEQSIVVGEYVPGYYIIDYLVWPGIDLALLILDYENPDGGIYNVDEPKERDYIDFIPLKIGNSFNLSELDTVYTAGYPVIVGSGFSDIYTPSIFITKSEINAFMTNEESWEQTDNYSIVYRGGIKGGASGGPLVNSKGELIGINGLIESEYIVEESSFGKEEIVPQTSLYNFAIDINDFVLHALLDDVNNKPESGFFGYLPKIKKTHQNELMNSWNKGSYFLPGVGYSRDSEE